ncbi:MAG: LCP family protein [Oscillospiraceae bacterium]|nr:LCP family protein [Oscillospiraceae bacterium]
MASKGAKIALTYLITIIVTLLVIGGIGYMLLQEIMAPKEEKQPEINLEQMGSINDYVPVFENNKTTLIIFDSEKRMSGCSFMVVRMLADERRITVMPLPSDTYSNVGGTENSIYEFYRLGGTADAVSAVEAALDVDIDYYLKLNNESFSVIVDIFGGVDFHIPYNLEYENPDTGEETIFREGETYLDSRDLRKIITYPLYSSGEEYRAKMTGVAVNDLINRNVAPGFSKYVDDYFSTIVNSTVETNFTAYDYESQADAIKYVSENDENICQLLTVTGQYNENALFVLDENFLKSLPERFKLYEAVSDMTASE